MNWLTRKGEKGDLGGNQFSEIIDSFFWFVLGLVLNVFVAAARIRYLCNKYIQRSHAERNSFFCSLCWYYSQFAHYLHLLFICPYREEHFLTFRKDAVATRLICRVGRPDLFCKNGLICLKQCKYCRSKLFCFIQSMPVKVFFSSVTRLVYR